jgi:hypothetical protein
MGSNAVQLFNELEDIEKDVTQESIFMRGVAYLRSIQVPLERFKLALDLASPLGNLDPTAATVVGVVKSVTAVSLLQRVATGTNIGTAITNFFHIQIAISFATADLEFARQIGEMLEQLSYIDDCDTLGQRANKADIHKVLLH